MHLAPGVLAKVVVVSLLVTFAASTPPAQSAAKVEADGPPNIVLILSDDQAPDLLAKMPYTNGRSDWTRFSNAFVNNPLCCPSRATILSGQYSHHHHVEENNLGNRFDASSTVATWLNSAGYRTGLVGKYLNGYPFGRPLFKPPGWDSWYSFTSEPQYYNYSLYENTVKRSYGSDVSAYSTDVLTSKAVSFIKSSSSDPFFLYYAPKTPHNPFDIATPRHLNDPTCAEVASSSFDRPNFAEADVTDKPLWVRKRPLPNRTIERTHRRQQCEMLLSLDDGVRSIFSALSSRGVLDNTVVIYMTDNGYANGVHRVITKRCEYEECISTPLLIRYPFAPHRSVESIASNVDIAPTIADLAGATPTRSQDGYSLVPLLQAGSPPPVWPNDQDGLLIHYIGFGTSADPSGIPLYWGVRTRGFKYVELSTGERELYDLNADPYELQNRAGQTGYLFRQAEMKAKLGRLKSR